MKSVVITCVIFLLMIAVIIGNAIHVNAVIDDLQSSLKAADLRDKEACLLILDGIKIKWAKQRDHIQASISHQRIDAVNDLLAALEIYAIYENMEEYEKTTVLLHNALDELRLLEKPTAVNIF